jgi:hypothetical protein
VRSRPSAVLGVAKNRRSGTDDTQMSHSGNAPVDGTSTHQKLPNPLPDLEVGDQSLAWRIRTEDWVIRMLRAVSSD